MPSRAPWRWPDPELERRRALLAAAIAETALPGPDEPDYEWRREELLEFGGTP